MEKHDAVLSAKCFNWWCKSHGSVLLIYRATCITLWRPSKVHDQLSSAYIYVHNYIHTYMFKFRII